jgi:hypothetical protein
MLRKILFISLALLLVSSALGFTKFNKTVLASSYTIDADAQQQILAATVRITLFAPLTDGQGNPQVVTVDGQKAIQYTVGEGLGTLTHSGADVFIVTHDHWTLLTPNLHKVQFQNVAGDLLLEVSGPEFQQMIRYRDGGTMVLDAANELVNGLTAVPTGSSQSVGKNNIVHLAYRQPQTGAISVAAMLVQELSDFQGQPVYRLVSLDGASVVGGNSGGGAYVDGQLVGNMWTTTMEREVLRATGEVVGQRTQTDLSLVAQLPITVLVQ